LILIFSLICRSTQLPAEDNARQNQRNQLDEWDQLIAENYRELVDPENMPRPEDDGERVFSGKLEVIDNWPVKDPMVGQIGGLAVDKEGYLFVFHRANRQWTLESFGTGNVFAQQKDGPIKEATLYKVNASNGIVLDKKGENRFYLPHGLHVDSEGNRWMTDVALHQVFKFEPGKDEPSLVLGKQFEPAKGNEDTERFCMPTDVTVASNGDIFVSDGYCASRVMKFDKTGKFVSQFGVGDSEIPHSITLAEDLDLICVADREGQRVLCYNAGVKNSTRQGEPEKEYSDSELGRVFSIEYSQTDGVLYGVTGWTGPLIPQGFTIDLRDDDHYKTDIIAMWSPEERGFDAPHAVAVSPDGECIFVGEIDEKGNPLWKFVKEEY